MGGMGVAGNEGVLGVNCFVAARQVAASVARRRRNVPSPLTLHHHPPRTPRLTHHCPSKSNQTIKCVHTKRGVGPKYAARIVATLGAENVIAALNSDDAAKELARVPGLGKAKAAAVKAEWDRSAGARGALAFLTGAAGLPAAVAHRVAQRHGASAEAAMR